MARVCTLKDWLKAFARKQEEDLSFFTELLSTPEISREISLELQRRLYERRKFSAFFRTLTWQHLSPEELAWCERKLEEVLAREDELHRLVNLLLEMLGEKPEETAFHQETLRQKEALRTYLKNLQ